MSELVDHLTCAWCHALFCVCDMETGVIKKVEARDDFVCLNCERARVRGHSEAIVLIETFANGLSTRDARGAAHVKDCASTLREVLKVPR